MKNNKDSQHMKLNYPLISYYCKSYEEYLTLPYKAIVGDGSRSVITGKKPIKVSLGVQKVDVELPAIVEGVVNIEGTNYEVSEDFTIEVDGVEKPIIEVVAKDEEVFEEFYYEVDGTLVSKDTPKHIIDTLNTNINTKSVYVEKKGYGEIAPNSVGCYSVYTDIQLANAGFKVDTEGRYVKTNDDRVILYKLKHIDETTINQVYQNNFKYVLNDANEYVRVNDEVAKTKFVKGLIRNDVANQIGDPIERIADLSKIIYFLLNKCESLLTEEEKAAMPFILSKNIEVSKLAELDDIENKVGAVVSKFKG